MCVLKKMVVMEAEEKYKKFLDEIMVKKSGEACLDPCQEKPSRGSLFCSELPFHPLKISKLIVFFILRQRVLRIAARYVPLIRSLSRSFLLHSQAMFSRVRPRDYSRHSNHDKGSDRSISNIIPM